MNCDDPIEARVNDMMVTQCSTPGGYMVGSSQRSCWHDNQDLDDHIEALTQYRDALRKQEATTRYGTWTISGPDAFGDIRLRDAFNVIRLMPEHVIQLRNLLKDKYPGE